MKKCQHPHSSHKKKLLRATLIHPSGLGKLERTVVLLS